MRRSTVAALIGAVGLVLPGIAAVGSVSLPEQVDRAVPARVVAVTQAAVLFTPGTVTRSKDRQYATVRVQYQCRNSTLYKHYVTGAVQQGQGDDAVIYSIGFRGEDGLRAAKCTGKLVTEALRVKRTWWTETQNKALVRGPAELTFSVSRHNAPGQGSGWYTTHSTASVVKKITVQVP